MKNICIIPARGGSKRIPKKNIKDFYGVPIIKYSIDIALKSKLFKEVIVSTDDNEISEISKKFGANVPFLRPKLLSDDYTGIQEVINHAIDYLKLKNNSIDFICCLFPTAPFVKVEELKKGLDLISKVKENRFTFSATKFSYPIQRSFSLNREQLADPFDKSFTKERSQDLKDFYHDAGQFYWGSIKSWASKLNLFEKSLPIILPSWRVQDLDTLEDWERAELIYRIIKEK